MRGRVYQPLGAARLLAGVLYVLIGQRLALAVSPCPPLHVTPSDPTFFSNFGGAVAVHNDVALIGAFGHCHPGHGCGAAYIFRRVGSSWIQEQEIWPSDPGAFLESEFGRAVAIEGDVALVGALNHLRPAPLSGGAVNVFRRGPSGWFEEQELLPQGSSGGAFGGAVALSGSLAVIGAWGDHTPTGPTGAAYVFRFDGRRWVFEQRLVASDGQSGDFFGWSVDISDDVILVGAYGDKDLAFDSGAAYVFRFNPQLGQWVQEQKLYADAKVDSGFGYSVSLDGNRALIGARFELPDGAAYFFEHHGAKWIRTQKLTRPEPAAQQFGFSVSLDRDFAVIGAWQSSIAAPQSGAAYLYRFNGHSWVQHGPTLVHNPGGGPFFGFSVGVSNGTAIVGANGESAPFGQSGAAYIYNVDPAPADLNCDNAVNTLDLGMLLVDWSIPARAPGCGGAVSCPADLNGDGYVNTLDLGMLLASWTL